MATHVGDVDSKYFDKFIDRIDFHGGDISVESLHALHSVIDGPAIFYLALPPGTLEWVADRSTVKQGRYTPGTHLPIVAPDRLAQEMPDDVLLLTWNFAEEILAQQAEYRQRGGRFIIPIPELRVV